MKRREAIVAGVKTYNTGKPCKHGHTSDRYTSTAICIECVQISGKKRRADNPEYNLKAWRKWLENNRETHSYRVKRWQAKNPEKVKTARQAWEKANPELVKAKKKRWIDRHPEKYTALSVASVAKRAKRVPKWNTPEDRWLMTQFYDIAKLRTKCTGKTWEVDHVLPLRGKSVSGLHVPANLQVVLKSENRAKRNFVNAELA